ncbi:MAG TPA: cysteine hydrolase family protein [Chitinophaga sp.]|uniref:cysteine hydrolase family protein n=1 Tax=Chitinophaga sp. TaxID=1869181 RepID=UPI002BE1D922|nr:cysteine hydrolase family protein [Chitinophaga sp.]HVI45939.1 cysteine hydrolase family protein [Chitinophaga sp.]
MKKEALIIIDVQNDYFKGGKMELVNPEGAADNIRRVLERSRQKNIPVIYIKHVATDPAAGFLVVNTPGIEINQKVAPVAGEKIITKQYPNSFRETELQEYLQKNGITDLTITGMMTHACVDATTRAAKDLGYNCTVIADACATRDLEVNGEKVDALQVQKALMGALAFYYAAVVTTDQFLN